MSTPTQVPQYYPARRPRSIFGPLVLIAIGVAFLLKNMGMISFHGFGRWFAHYWPLLLILWGVIRLGEYLWARQQGYATPRLGGGAITFLVFFIIFGLMSTQAARYDWNQFGDHIRVGDGDADELFGMFGGTAYDFTNQFTQPAAAATQFKIICNRAEIKVSASQDSNVHAVVHKKIRSDSQAAAQQINEQTMARFDQQGSMLVLDMSSGAFDQGRYDVDLELPRNAALSVSSRTGNIHVADRTGNVELSIDHGDATVEQVKGDASLHLRKGNATARNISGNVTLDGVFDDTDLSDIGGTVTLTGTYYGETQLARIAKPVRFNSTRTDMQFNKLDGEFNMKPDDLRASGIIGPFRLETRSKSIHLEDTVGDVHIQNRNAPVEIQMKSPLGAMDVNSVHGEVSVEVPANAAFQLDAQSLSGEIETDFGINVDNTRNDATAKANVGKGGPAMRLRADHGRIEVRKRQ
jgi:hypothetical protein